MSVQTRGKGGTYHYAFRLKGLRFHGSTETTDIKQAKKVEKAAREQALVAIHTAKTQNAKPMTLNAAFDRFWEEVAQHYKGTWGKTTKTALKWLAKDSGLNLYTLVNDLDAAAITGAIARRRGEGVANSTVNKTVTELLKQIWLRSRDLWGQQVKPLEWKKLKLKGTPERIKSLKAHEEPKLLEVMRPDYLPAIRFAIKSGFRKREIVNLKKKDIDWGNRTITVLGKGDRLATIPLSTELRKLLWPLVDKTTNPTEYVFTYVSKRTRPNPKTGVLYVRGQVCPISYSGLGTAWTRYAKKAGLEDFHLHDLRHTAATRLARVAFKVVQKLMRHSDIQTTAKYMAVYDDDVRAAMELETQAHAATANRQQAGADAVQADESKGQSGA
jgi:integrase